ncbi:hypothetical protein Ahy_A03g011316 isoform B [Arachis hypogaea]|uniref:RRM domain-containing protein n=1 Tax=Arachis hypogaea TaxID=3818 RepID=A0A445DQD1_ARAHY|nr:hypothetical protein Ahy_A03g011316 isoform B [Arachis hypogaea]
MCSLCFGQSIRRARPFPWQHDLFEDSLRAAGIQGIEVGTKLYVSNLDHGVTNEDIRELFAELGELKRYAVHYDKNGHQSVSIRFFILKVDAVFFPFCSILFVGQFGNGLQYAKCDIFSFPGSAEVVYTRRSDAFAALKRYNNVLLDGKPMKIEIVGANAELPVTARVNVTEVNGQRKRTVVMAPRGGRGGGPAVPNRGAGIGAGWGHRGGPPRSGNGRGRGRGRGRAGVRGRGKKDAVEKSVEQLDKELENYHADAMQF